MNKLRIAALLFLAAVSTTFAQQTNTVDLAALAKNRAEWPAEVALTEKMEFPVAIDGKEIGSAVLPVGMKVKLIEVQSEQVKVANGGAVKVIPVKSTDLIARVIQAREGRRKVAIIRENADKQNAAMVHDNRQTAGKLYISTDTDGRAAQANSPPVQGELIVKDVEVLKATAKTVTPTEQDGVIAVKFTYAFNFINWDQGIISATIKTVDGHTELVVFPELGMSYMRRYTNDLTSEKAKGLVYGVRKPTVVISERTRRTVSDTAIYLLGRQQMRASDGKLRYSWAFSP